MSKTYEALEMIGEDLILIDQRYIPLSFDYFTCKTVKDTAFAINDMVVRGAPAIGGVAAYGVYFAAKEADGNIELFDSLCCELISARPTAVNLEWAVKRVKNVALNSNFDLIKIRQEADSIKAEDIAMNYALSKLGSDIIKPNSTILTHCNAGALATCGWGTALGVIKQAHVDGKNIFVYADETRPRLQGARLTAWELVQAEIPSCLIPDSAAATLIRDGKIDYVILGADRITANGDVANKLGTFMLSVLCKEYNVPFYSVAPTSTIDFETKSGKDIVIEERDEREVKFINSVQVAPLEISVYNPSFDVTPHENITGIITEKGIIRAPFDVNIEKIKQGKTL